MPTPIADDLITISKQLSDNAFTHSMGLPLGQLKSIHFIIGASRTGRISSPYRDRVR